jgi:hypothetical protein
MRELFPKLFEAFQDADPECFGRLTLAHWLSLYHLRALLNHN